MSFDRIAPHYQFFETIAFGHALQRARTAFISQIRDDQRVLLVGEGDGRFLAELLRRKPEIEIDCVDASAAMIQSARARAAVIASTARDLASGHKRLASSVGPSRTGVVCALRDDASLQLSELTRVQFHHADILDWVPPQKSYDLVVTHFFLDCFNRNQLSGVIAKLERAAAPRARWLVADFAIPPNGFRHIHAKIWLRAMYSFFGVVADLEANDLVDPSPFIRAAGFQLHREVVTRFGLIKSQVWERSS